MHVCEKLDAFHYPHYIFTPCADAIPWTLNVRALSELEVWLTKLFSVFLRCQYVCVRVLCSEHLACPLNQKLNPSLSNDGSICLRLN